MKKTPITIAFSDYTGPQEYHPSIQYIAKKFKEQKKSGPQVKLVSMELNRIEVISFLFSQMRIRGHRKQIASAFVFSL